MRSPPAPSAPLIGDTHIPLRLLHSSRAFSRGYPYVAPAPPTPPAPAAKATHTPLPATPTPPAPAALLPRPHRGRGPCPGVYQESSRIRGGAGGKSVSGSFPPIPWHWTVGISPRGVGPTGRGNEFPLPCLSRSQNSEYLTDPVRVPCKWVPKELAGPPPLPRLRRSSPAPFRGGVGSAWRYQGNRRIRLFSRISPRCGPCGYRHGGWGRRGGGTRSPSPVSNAPEIPHIFSAPPHPHLRRNTHTLLSAFLPVEDTRTLLPAPLSITHRACAR